MPDASNEWARCPGLVLLDNGGDEVTVPVNATQFSMPTKVTYGSPYAISIKAQPYGFTLTCSVSAASGTAPPM